MLRRRQLLGLPFALSVACTRRDPSELLHVSYDATRELYAEITDAFVARMAGRFGAELTLRASHGGSAKQARSVVEGLAADVASLALAFDVEALVRAGHVAPGWAGRLPHAASPFTSTVVLLVRRGNPLGISDLHDLVRPDVIAITPNPKTSGGARWGHLALFHVLRRAHGAAKAEELLGAFYGRVPVLPSGARTALTTFGERGIGDVLLAWESEARVAARSAALEVVTPRSSILAEPPVVVVDRVVDRRGSRPAAEAFTQYLFEDEAQRIAAAHFLRPRSPGVATTLPELERFDLREVAGSWEEAHREHFADGGLFDRAFEGRG